MAADLCSDLPSIDFTTVDNVLLGECIFEKLKLFDQCWLADEKYSKVLYPDFLQEALKIREVMVSAAIKPASLKPGEIVHFISENSLELCAAFCACTFLNVITVGSNSLSPLNELRCNIINTCSSVLIVSKSIFENFGPIKDLASIHTVIVMEVPKNSTKFCVATEIFTLPSQHPDLKSEDLTNVALMLCTSGTSGKHKAIKYEHRSLLRSCLFSISKSSKSSSVVICNKPFPNIGGIMTFINAIYTGKNLYMMEGFDPKTFLYAVEKFRVTILITTPAMLQSLVKLSDLKTYDLSSVKVLVVGGSMIDTENIKLFKCNSTLSDNVLYINGYGSSEVGGSTVSATRLENYSSSVGKLLPNFSMKIIDQENQNVCNFFEDGEILIKSPVVMKGYFQNSGETDFTEDGYFKTGDIGHIDEKHNLFITGRISSIINFRSFRLHPSEIEEVLHRHPAIKEAAVVGKKHEEHGEVPIAFVALLDKHSSLKGILKYLKDNLSEHKLPFEIRILPSIPLNLGNKFDIKYLKGIL